MADDISIKNILIIDDDEDYRVLIKTYLNKYLDGVNIVVYDPVAEGIPGDSFNWSDYDVTILDYDLNVEDITGLDLLHKNRHKLDFPAVIMLTGAADQDTAMSALDFGAAEFLRKETLDKMQLIDTIKTARTKQKESRKKLSELEKVSHSFDKAGFYKRLGEHAESGEANRVFLYLSIDDYKMHTDENGAIVSANLLSHIAKSAFRYFQIRKNITNITRINDSSLGLLIDHSGTVEQLNEVMQGLCDYLLKRNYFHYERQIPFTVSIGGRMLGMGSNKELVAELERAMTFARLSSGNSFYIYASKTDRHGFGYDGKTKPRVGRTGPNEIDIDEKELDEDNRRIKQAFDENRGQKWFHPVVSTSTSLHGMTPPIIKVSVGMIEKDNNIVTPVQLSERIQSDVLRQYIDRWILRELLARIIGDKKSETSISYMLTMNNSWFVDISLFNWLKDLISRLEKFNQGHQLVLVMPVDILNSNKKKATALLTSLKEAYKFQLALGGIKINDESSWPDDAIKFDFGIIAAKEIQEYPDFSNNVGVLIKNLKTLKADGISLIIDGVENSTMLTDVISFGADFVMGPFVDEAENEYATMERISAL